MKPSILFCYPSYSGPPIKALYYQFGFMQHVGKAIAGGKYDFKTLVVGPRKSIRMIRNAACEEALAGGYTHLFFMDDDIAPKPNVLDLLLSVNEPIVGAFVRNADGDPCVWRWHGGELKRHDPISFDVPAIRCDAIGSGCMLIQVEALRKMAEPRFWFDRNGRTMDVNLCLAARAIGLEVWCSLDGEVRQIVPTEVEV